MLPSNKKKIPQYYVSTHDVYQIESNNLVKLGHFNDLKEDTSFKFPHICKVFLAADCYKIFISPAEVLYSPKRFQQQVEQRFKLCFPHLNVAQYYCFYNKPRFESPYLAVAIEKDWYNNFINIFKFKSLDYIEILPLASFIYFQKSHKNNFCFKEPSLETHFIHVDGQLHQVIQKNKNMNEASHFHLLEKDI
ncbi:hypothetical protein B9T26_07700 [Acinetobacter sp. ANC 4169]|uniref:hypothetical protein n=1 Tax=Acinetobacter sp. ANC 4169 TaxID=1977879 RepID=UPI000A355E6D|nr:hypothetical protein [Acinetobacter sp. ANC 4169]OTG74012.1 hypothetical protein B9T26_07700 [Acinetobacter sp. ANC 4169]